MVTRSDIIKILNQHKTREARRKAVEEFLLKNVLTAEDGQKIIDDLESYAEY